MLETIKYIQDLKSNTSINKSTELIDSGVLDSFDIMSIMDHLEKYFNIEILGEDIVPENFKTVGKMLDMVQRNGGKVEE